MRQLGLATLAFAITFWAWNLIAPLGVLYTAEFGLSSGEKALLVALPVLVGSLGRIVTGALTDRLGGRLMFTVLCFGSIAPVLLVAFAGNHDSFALLLGSALLLGIAGTTFAVGIPFVNAWFDPARRGFATGVFGAGMGGTALSAFFTPRFVNWFGYTQTYLLVAAGLAVVGLLIWLFVRESPRWTPNRDAVIPNSSPHSNFRSHGKCRFCTPLRSVDSLPSRLTCRPISRMSQQFRPHRSGNSSRRIRTGRRNCSTNRRCAVRQVHAEARGLDLIRRSRGHGAGGCQSARP